MVSAMVSPSSVSASVSMSVMVSVSVGLLLQDSDWASDFVQDWFPDSHSLRDNLGIDHLSLVNVDIGGGVSRDA